MNSQEIITLYEEVAILTHQMLDAARNGDWIQLAALESRCIGYVETLKQGAPSAPLSGVVRDRKAQILKEILADDREIRTITEPWMAQLSEIMNSARTERQLSKAFGGNRAS